MLILALDSALARTSAAVFDDDRAVATDIRDIDRGMEFLPEMTKAVLEAAGLRAAALDLVAVTVGPGGFTGIRGALALAHGLGLAAGVPVVGVTVPESLGAVVPVPAGRRLMVAIDNRRGRVFLASGATMEARALDDLPLPERPIVVAGDAADSVAERLRARGVDVMLSEARLPDPLGIARAARARLRGLLPALPAQPLYVDPPEARLPTGGLRPAPAG